MSKFENDLLLMHFVDQTLFPQKDKELWLAYALLSNRYPTVVYWCIDTFHVEAIVDYKYNLILGQRHKEFSKLSTWEGEFDWDKLTTIHSFNKDIDSLTTHEIVTAWMEATGETKESKQAYVRSLKKGK